MENAINNSHGNQREHTSDNHTFTNVYSIPKFENCVIKIVATPLYNTPLPKVLTDCLIVT